MSYRCAIHDDVNGTLAAAGIATGRARIICDGCGTEYLLDRGDGHRYIGRLNAFDAGHRARFPRGWWCESKGESSSIDYCPECREKKGLMPKGKGGKA